METRAKRKAFNIIMVALIVVIVFCGVMVVGHIQGWFGGGDGSSDGSGQSILTTTSVTGVVNVERSGVGYTLKEGTVMQSGDIVETKNGSEAVMDLSGDSPIALNEKTELAIPSCEGEDLQLQLQTGEVFADVSRASAACSIAFGKNTAIGAEAVFSLSQQKSSSTLCVYGGSMEVTAEDGSSNTVQAGEQILITRNQDDRLTVETSTLRAESLNDYIIGRLLACKAEGLCFGAQELTQVREARDAEKQAAAKALEAEAIGIAAGEAQAAAGETAGDGGSTASGGDVMTCTISIRCKAILDNMDKLKEGKNRYVPPNGIILSTSSVEFRKGETAYDVTKRACAATDIQIEAKYTPVYGSYYVEGINHLYEFDCGEMSGWLYRVNGWTPNYGCSEYTLKNGDSIVWDYTCTGY